MGRGKSRKYSLNYKHIYKVLGIPQKKRRRRKIDEEDKGLWTDLKNTRKRGHYNSLSEYQIDKIIGILEILDKRIKLLENATNRS